MPNIIASQILGVQSMTASTGHIFSVRPEYVLNKVILTLRKKSRWYYTYDVSCPTIQIRDNIINWLDINIPSRKYKVELDDTHLKIIYVTIRKNEDLTAFKMIWENFTPIDSDEE